MLSNRNCFKVLVKMISASPIARLSVIQILDDGDAAFRILGAGLRTVLSVTTMFADKPRRLNGRIRAAILCFDDLASGYRTRGWATRAAGYRAAISCVVNSGRHLINSSSSDLDPEADIDGSAADVDLCDPTRAWSCTRSRNG